MRLSSLFSLIITILSNIFVKIVDCRVIIINRAHHCGFNRRIIEKSSGHFLIALVVDPLFSPANGQFFISTWRRRVCRGLLSIAFDRAHHSASNGLNIVHFGPFIIVFDGYVRKYYLTLLSSQAPRQNHHHDVQAFIPYPLCWRQWPMNRHTRRQPQPQPLYPLLTYYYVD